MIEVYRCKDCNICTRFPRYNHPQKLMETQTGRCGEYANAFTCMCIAIGHDARLIRDWTDHVWTEVYIDAEQRWITLDSCENSWDQPLIYEKGWGKELTYVIAFSTKEIVDVTPRYVVDPVLNATRRKDVNEEWLANLIKTKREQLWQMQGGPAEVKYFSERYEKEDKELLFGLNGEGKDGETYLPRQSGSLEWR